jgi:hypothetical protein
MHKLVKLGLIFATFSVHQSLADNNLPARNKIINSNVLPSSPSQKNDNGYENDPSSSQSDIGYEPQINGGYADLASLSEFFKDKAPMISEMKIKTKVDALQGKTLLDPIILELPNFVEGGGVTNNILTIDGIFKILQAGGKIKHGFVVTENLLGNIELGHIVKTSFGEITRLETGFFSDQIYKITLNPTAAVDAFHSSFIIKSVRSAWGAKVKNRKQETPIKEIQDLKRVEQIILPEVTYLKSKNPLFPTLAVPDKSYYYFDADSLKHYIAIIPLSAGKSVQEFLKRYLWYNDVKELDGVMKKVGRALGEFHYNLASTETKHKLNDGTLSYADFKTLIHGDFHQGNVFIHQDEVTFIDNATIANSIVTSLSPIVDIYRFYGFTYTYTMLQFDPHQFRQVNNSFESFIDGYVSAFPMPIQDSFKKSLQMIFEEINTAVKKQFEDYLTNKVDNIVPVVTNNRNLQWFLNFVLANVKQFEARGGGKSTLAEKLFQTPARGESLVPNTEDKSSNSEPVGFYID